MVLKNTGTVVGVFLDGNGKPMANGKVTFTPEANLVSGSTDEALPATVLGKPLDFLTDKEGAIGEIELLSNMVNSSYWLWKVDFNFSQVRGLKGFCFNLPVDAVVDLAECDRVYHEDIILE